MLRSMIAASIIFAFLSPSTADAKGRHHHKHHHHYRHHDGAARHYARHRHHRSVRTARQRGISTAGMPGQLASKVSELERACGSRLISGYRPGARVAGSGRLSNHARHTAADVQGNPRCIYAHLKGWPGGYSIDYGAVNHVHISYDRAHEWGARFAHYGGHHRYARRHIHYASR